MHKDAGNTGFAAEYEEISAGTANIGLRIILQSFDFLAATGTEASGFGAGDGAASARISGASDGAAASSGLNGLRATRLDSLERNTGLGSSFFGSV